MSFSSYPQNDLLATITSAFDIKSCPEERIAGISNLVPAFDLSCKSEFDPPAKSVSAPAAAAPSGEDLPPFGHICHSDSVMRDCFPSDLKYQSTPRQSEAVMLQQIGHVAADFAESESEISTFWTDPSSGHHYAPASRSSSATREVRKKETVKLQQSLKQRYNQTLNLLKKAELYDLTMKVADLVKKNSQLHHEIENLRAECASGYCYPTPTY